MTTKQDFVTVFKRKYGYPSEGYLFSIMDFGWWTVRQEIWRESVKITTDTRKISAVYHLSCTFIECLSTVLCYFLQQGNEMVIYDESPCNFLESLDLFQG